MTKNPNAVSVKGNIRIEVTPKVQLKSIGSWYTHGQHGMSVAQQVEAQDLLMADAAKLQQLINSHLGPHTDDYDASMLWDNKTYCQLCEYELDGQGIPGCCDEAIEAWLLANPVIPNDADDIRETLATYMEDPLESGFPAKYAAALKETLS